MPAKYYHQKIEDWAAGYKGAKYHASMTDAPYHHTSIVKRFGGKEAAAAKHGKDGAFARTSRGFMGMEWDGGDVAFRKETWQGIAEHLLPGAFGVAFAAARGWHRMAVAIEDAGLIIHPSIFMLGWAFGSGFPKATNIDKAIDKQGGGALGWFGDYLREYREKHGITQKELAQHFPSKTGRITGCVANWEKGYNAPTVDQYNKLVEVLGLPFPSIEEAERTIVGTKKDVGNRHVSIISNEAGEYHITEPSSPLAQVWEGHRYGQQAMSPALEPIIVYQKPYEGRPLDNIVNTGAGALNIRGTMIPALVAGDKPRWASNLILDSDSADWLDERSGDLKSGSPVRGTEPSEPASGVYEGRYNRVPYEGRADAGGASRYFFQYQQDNLENGDPIFYEGKATTAEREAGLDDFEPIKVKDGRDSEIDNPYQRGETLRRNPHPTIKPISLTAWLATLLLPPAHYTPRRLMIPFAGVGSEMIGAELAGWDEVDGIEMMAEYVKVGEARIKWWAEIRARYPEMSYHDLLQTVNLPKPKPQGQMSIFDVLHVDAETETE